jgi:hypothetical protein
VIMQQRWEPIFDVQVQNIKTSSLPIDGDNYNTKTSLSSFFSDYVYV